MSRHSVNVGGKDFKSKAALYSFCRELFDGYKDRVVSGNHIQILGEDLKFTTELLKRHPSYEIKRGAGISKVFIGRNFSGGTHMLIERVDGSMVDVSWVQCCHQRSPSKKTELLLAMRTAISNQLLDFKKRTSHNCAVCKTIQNLEVDHMTISFKQLAEEYLNWASYNPITFDQDPTLLQICFSPVDFEFSSLWQCFHLNAAKLQFLCKQCHITKTAEERGKTT